MKNLPSIIAAVLLAAVLLFYMCTFQVRSTEVAIVKTFGEADRTPIEIDEDDAGFFAGLRYRWPWPIQSVEKYDKRLRLLEDRIEETPTLDSKQIIITTFAAWRISDPFKFHTRYQTVEAGEDALRDRIRSFKKAVVGRHDFSDFVSTDAEDRKLREIEQEMLSSVAQVAADEFGIKIELFGIKQLSLPESVTEAVFTTMKTTQENLAKKYRTEGSAEATAIVARAEESRQRILAVVNNKVAEIQSTGQAEVGRIYAQFREHQELRIFLDKLRALEEIIQNRAEIFMDTEFVPADLFDPSRRMAVIPVGPDTEAGQASRPADGE